jgi:hypothetical protein
VCVVVSLPYAYSFLAVALRVCRNHCKMHACIYGEGGNLKNDSFVYSNLYIFRQQMMNVELNSTKYFQNFVFFKFFLQVMFWFVSIISKYLNFSTFLGNY